jgi:hypothetical protein
MRAGIELSGPVTYFTDKNILNEEGYISVDLNEKRSVLVAAGHLNFKYSQYNYSYTDKGNFIRIGMDFNLLKPEKSMGKYWAGIGLRYGLARLTSEVPSFYKEDYWGKTSSSIGQKTNWAHFVEISPGVRTEIFNHLSIGWSANLRMLIYSGTGKDLKSIYIPGFGDATKTISTSLSYFIVWNIPYKTINVIRKKEAKEEPEDNEDTDTSGNNQNSGTTGTSGNRQQGKIRP